MVRDNALTPRLKDYDREWPRELFNCGLECVFVRDQPLWIHTERWQTKSIVDKAELWACCYSTASQLASLFFAPTGHSKHVMHYAGLRVVDSEIVRLSRITTKLSDVTLTWHVMSWHDMTAFSWRYSHHESRAGLYPVIRDWTQYCGLWPLPIAPG